MKFVHIWYYNSYYLHCEVCYKFVCYLDLFIDADIPATERSLTCQQCVNQAYRGDI